MKRRAPTQANTTNAVGGAAAPPAVAAERLLELRVARIIATDPRALDLLIEAGFTPLATPALRAALANTVSLRQAIRLRGLSDGAAEALIGALLDLAPLTELIDASR